MAVGEGRDGGCPRAEGDCSCHRSLRLGRNLSVSQSLSEKGWLAEIGIIHHFLSLDSELQLTVGKSVLSKY